MSLSRDDLASYLQEEFHSLAQNIGQASDPATGFAPAINHTFRKLGVLEADLGDATISDADRDKALALAEYYALRHFMRQLLDRVNHTMGETTYNYTNQMNQVKAMMDDAAKLCGELGVSVRSGAWSVGWMNLDWIEAEERDV
jgi:hypothetical protein